MDDHTRPTPAPAPAPAAVAAAAPPPAQPQHPPPPPPVTGYPAAPPPYSNNNTAYPYYNPNYDNPNYNYNNNQQQQQQQFYTPQRISLLRRLIAIIVGIFIIFATISFIIWLVLRPRLPQFTVDSFNLSNFTLSSSQISGDWDLRFAVRNPNKKMSIYYDRLDSFLYYKSAFVSESSLAPFAQGTRSQTVVNASFASRGNYVDSWVVNDINEEKKVGNVGFDVRVLARVRFTNGVWRMRRRLLRVLCSKVKIRLNGGNSSSSGSLLTGNWECRVGKRPTDSVIEGGLDLCNFVKMDSHKREVMFIAEPIQFQSDD